MKFEEFNIGQVFQVSITIEREDLDKYLSFARTKNILHEDPEVAEKEGIKGIMIPGRAIIARAEGEMTRLKEFEGCIMLLYGMDGDPDWNNRHTRFINEVYVGEELNVKYRVSEKREGKDYGILGIDLEITRVRDNKLVAVSKRNLYRIKK